MKKRKKAVNTLLTITILIVLFAVYFYFENTSLQVTAYSVSNGKLPASFDNYKIVQVSDYHNTKSKRLNRSIIDGIAYESPDAIAITGDLIDSNKADVDAAVEFIKSIKDIAPVYYVIGNHEARMPNYKSVINRISEQDINILSNEAQIISKEDGAINILGIDDPRKRYDKKTKNSTIVTRELEELEYDDSLFSLLLSHRPELLEVYANKNVDLVLSGHAHGGQIILPFVGSVYAPNQGWFPQYTRGMFMQDDTSMIVSRGLGNSRAPFRINNNPELVVITLHSA